MAKTDAPATAPTPAPDEKEPVIQMTQGQLDALINNMAKQIEAKILAAKPDIPGQAKRLRNADLATAGAGPRIQTREQVAIMANIVGPVSHEPGFYADPPEDVSSRDWEENRPLISQLENLGYTVTLKGVEFGAFWNPQKRVIEDGKAAWRPEIDEKGNHTRMPPEHAEELLQQLRDIDPAHSRIWILRWRAGKIITGNQEIDALVANERSPMAQYTGNVLAQAEARQFTGFDNTGLGV